MAGYTRTDTTNNIADGNIINATDLDNEFDGIQAAFNSSTGHNHDGTTGEGAPILVLGPTQDVVVGAAAVTPKTTNTVDIGSGSLKFKDLFLAGNGSIGGTLAVTGVATLTAQPVLSSLTASRAVFTDGSKGLVSNAITGTGNVVMSASPTLTGTIGGENATLSGTLGVTGVATFTAQPIVSSLTASRAVFSDGSKGLVSNAITGTGNVVMSAAPTLTGTITAEALTLSGATTLSGGTANGVTYLNGSKVLTSGSALTFDGTRLTVKGGNANSLFVDNGGQQYTEIDIANNGTIKSSIYWDNTNTNLAYGSTGSATYTAATSTYHAWYISSEQMRLTSTGLGIGTSSPGAKLTVAGIAELIRMANATPYLSFYNAAQSTRFGYIQHNGTNLALVNEQAGALEMYTSNTLRATLDSSGNLGIGTSSPTVKLDVVGTSATEQFRIGNTTGGTDFGITVTENASTIINSAEGATGRGIQFQSGGTNTVLIDSSGNVGIGTSSPDANLTVNGAASFAAGTAAAPSIARAGDLNTGIFFPAADTIAFSEGGAESMRIDSSGNLGLGVTPSAWRTSEYKAIQVGIGASFYGRVTAGDEDKAGFSANAFFDQTDSRWEYIATDSASRYDQIGGGHFWFTAPSGTAGNAITFTQAMALDASGNVGVGVTPSAWTIGKALQVNGASILSTGTEMYLSANAFYGASAWTYRQTDFAAQYYQLNGAHVWRTAASGTAGNAITFTQPMTLDASGNLGVGTTSPGNKLSVVSSDTTVATFRNPGAAISQSLVGNTAGDLSLRVLASGDCFIFSDTSKYLAFGTSATERARITSGGDLLVGTTSDGAGIGVASRLAVRVTTGYAAILRGQTVGNAIVTAWNSTTTGDGVFHEFGTETSYTARGTISYNRAGGLVAYNTTSDYRAKDISGPVVGSGALIDSVPVYMGKMKDATQERPMFIAHETPAYAHTGVKDAVDAEGNPVYQQMDASALIPVMWAEIQSLRQRLAAAGI